MATAPKIESNKLGRIVTVVGSALYCSVPNASQYDENKYETSLIITADEFTAFQTEVKALYEKAQADGTKMVLPFDKAAWPVKESVDREGNPTGDMIIKAKTSIKYPPNLFDSAGKPVKFDSISAIPNRSKIRLQVGVEIVSSGMYKGIVLRLNGIKIIDVPNYGADAFDGYEDEGTFSADDTNTTGATEDWVD